MLRPCGTALLRTARAMVACALTVLLLTAASTADVIHVPRDHPTIQAAIDAAKDGDEIVVAPGTYFENINLLGKAVHLRSSDGPEKTIMDGQSIETVIVCDSGEGPDTIVQGFTIRHGVPVPGPLVLGMRNIGSSPTVIDCHFRPIAWPSHIAMRNENGSPSIIDCTFLMGNIATCMSNVNANVLVMNCTFASNFSHPWGGAGMNNFNSNVVIENCTFQQNTGHSGPGAIWQPDGTLEIIGSTFRDNTSDYALAGAVSGGSATQATITVTDCVFENNGSGKEGPGALEGAQQIVGSVFINNDGRWGAGAVSIKDGGLIDNCVFIGNMSNFWSGAVSAENATILNSSFINNVGNIWAMPSGSGAAVTASGTSIGSSHFCGNSPAHIFGDWTSLGDNAFADNCPIGDLNGDGVVDVLDLLILLGAWGACDDCRDCAADFNGDCSVDSLDLLILLANWG